MKIQEHQHPIPEEFSVLCYQFLEMVHLREQGAIWHFVLPVEVAS
jgi:hypothetical protein